MPPPLPLLLLLLLISAATMLPPIAPHAPQQQQQQSWTHPARCAAWLARSLLCIPTRTSAKLAAGEALKSPCQPLRTALMFSLLCRYLHEVMVGCVADAQSRVVRHVLPSLHLFETLPSWQF